MKKLFVFVSKFFSKFWNQTEIEKKHSKEIEALLRECQSFTYAAVLFSDEHLNDLKRRVFLQILKEQEHIYLAYHSGLHLCWFPSMIVYVYGRHYGSGWQKYYDEISVEIDRRLIY